VTERSRRERSVRIAVGSSALVVGLNLNTVSIAFADMRQHSFENESLAALGWVLSVYTIFFGALLVPAGRLADRLGRRSVFLWGLGVFSLGSLVTGLGPELWVVIAGRVVQGIGAAAIVPSSLGLLLDATPPARRATATAFYSGLSSLGGALGPTVGASVVRLASWRWSFLLSPVIAAVSYLFGRTSLPRVSTDKRAALPDVLGASIIVVMLTSLSLAIVQGRAWGWSSGRVVGAFVFAALMVPTFVVRSRRHPSPVLPLSLFGRRSFACANTAAFTFGVSTGAVLFSNVQFLNVVWQRSVFESGLGLLPLALTAAVVAPFAGRLGARFGERAVAVPGALVIAAGIAGYRVFATEEVHYVARWLPGCFLFGAGLALTYPMIAAISVRGVPSNELSVASASNRTALQVGNAVGIALVIAVLGDPRGPEALASFRRAWVVMIIGALVTAGALVSVGRGGSHVRTEPARPAQVSA
jgi:EmrB/QacA subfamily drug resistance transporter